MKLLLVTVRKRPGSDEESKRETILEGQEIQIGRAVSMEICLPDIGVDFKHATLTQRDGKLIMTSTGVGGLEVGGKDRDEVDLGSETAKIGRFSFRGEAGRDGADAVLVMTEDAVVAPKKKKKSKRVLEDVLPSRRLLSWVFALAIIGVFFAWPMSEVLTREAPNDDAVVVEGMARTDVPDPSPMEVAWSSGQISESHAMIQDDCGAIPRSIRQWRSTIIAVRAVTRNTMAVSLRRPRLRLPARTATRIFAASRRTVSSATSPDLRPITRPSRWP
jgi:hypothetical protein